MVKKLMSRTDKFNLACLFLVSAIIQIFFFYSVRLSFECDSLAYYNSALGYFSGNPSLVSPYRGPIYAIALKFFGVIDFGWVYPLILIQAFLGAILPVLVFLILREFGKIKAYVGYSLFVLSSISFTAAKLILAEQFFLTFIIVSVFFLQKFLTDLSKTNLKKFIWFASLASLTRWEGLALVFGSLIVFALMSFKNVKFRKRLYSSLILFSIIFGGYAGLRAMFYDDIKMFGLQNGTGTQWLWRQYASQGQIPGTSTSKYDVLSGIETPHFKGDINQATGAYSRSHIQNVFQETVNYVMQNDNEFDELRKTAADNKNLNPEVVQKLEKNPLNVKYLINEAWKVPSTSGSHITFLMSRAILQKYGLVDGDKILQRAALDILMSETEARKVVVRDAMQLIGLGKFSLKERIQWYEGPELNIGGCLNATLNKNFIKNHNDIYKFYNSTLHDYASQSRNLIRAVFPFLFIASLIQIVVYRRVHLLFLILVLSTLVNITIVSLTGGGSYNKYDLSIFSYLIIGLLSGFSKKLPHFTIDGKGRDLKIQSKTKQKKNQQP
jgi:hypothetical protein